MVFIIFIQINIEQSVNSRDPDQMLQYLGLECLPMSHKKDPRLICLIYGLSKQSLSHGKANYACFKA